MPGSSSNLDRQTTQADPGVRSANDLSNPKCDDRVTVIPIENGNDADQREKRDKSGEIFAPRFSPPIFSIPASSRGDSFGESEHQHDDRINRSLSTSPICGCDSCRTRFLTDPALLTLKCNYCSAGFLVPKNGVKNAAQSQSQNNKTTQPNDCHDFICIDCGKSLRSLRFISRLCDELQRDIEFWRTQFESKCAEIRLQSNESHDNGRDDVLRAWIQTHRELRKLLATDCWRMIENNTRLAGAHRTIIVNDNLLDNKQQLNQDYHYREVNELNHSVIRSLSHYHIRSLSRSMVTIIREQILPPLFFATGTTKTTRLNDDDHDHYDDEEEDESYESQNLQLRELKRKYV